MHVSISVSVLANAQSTCLVGFLSCSFVDMQFLNGSSAELPLSNLLPSALCASLLFTVFFARQTILLFY